MSAREKVTSEQVKAFLEGRDPQKHIVNLDYNSQNDYITVYYRNENDVKCRRNEPFHPFVWATRSACLKLCKGNKEELLKLMRSYNIECIKLDDKNVEGVPCAKMANGYLFMFRAKTPMSYSKFLQFFKRAENPIYSQNKNGENTTQSSASKRQYLIVTPQEQFLISTGKRFFKGYDDYDQILRMIFDLETQGLDPTRHRIEWYGIRFNRPVTYKGVTKNYTVELQLQGNTEEEKDKSELNLITTALKIIYTFKPDVITAHNGEIFDWNFIIERCRQLGTSIEAVSAPFFEGRTIAKNNKETVLKLGGEVEHFYQTIVPNIIITDSLHAVRRAQATDSSFKEANLKYATQYLKLVKKKRVYVPGNDISKISNDYEEHYAFNDETGDWYLYDPNYTPSKESVEEPKKEIKEGSRSRRKKLGKKFVLVTKNIILDGYTLVNGHYIVERYLGDDLWECDKVELALNGTDFMLCKIVPVPFSKAVTMGTAGQWKAIMMAWSYENNLAIPLAEDTGSFTGGLSRLLKVGRVENVIKLDYNSLYPSILLTWAISDENDLMGSMLAMLEYVLTTREYHKGLKKKAGKVVDECEEKLNENIQLSQEEFDNYNFFKNQYKIEDNRQAVFKKTGNSFFGSYGSNNGSVFPWKSVVCAERTTCTGRQSLRLMISHFSNMGKFLMNGHHLSELKCEDMIFIKYDNSNIIERVNIETVLNKGTVELFKILTSNGWCRNGNFEPITKNDKTILLKFEN